MVKASLSAIGEILHSRQGKVAGHNSIVCLPHHELWL
jgi:hypothetical protein